MMRGFLTLSTWMMAAMCLAQPSSFNPDGLVAWWDFDGDFCSEDGAHCFEEFGALQLQASNDSAGHVVEFNGGYLELGADEVFDLEEFTIVLRGYADDRIEFWKGSPGYPDDVNYRVVMGSSAVHPIGYSSGCGLTLDGANTTVWSVPAMQVDQAWQTVVFSRSTLGVVTVYTSEGVATWETGGGICTESNPLRLGRWWDGDTQPSQGLVDFLGIWSRSFDLEEAIQVVNIQGGCTDPLACNYEEEALFHDGNCQYFSECCPVGQLWDPASQICRLLLDSTSVCGPGTTWDVLTQSCIVAGNLSDTDFDGCVGMADLLDLLSAFGTCVGFSEESDNGVVAWSCGDPLEYQGYDYETVLIGDQCWFAENLRSQVFSNGDSLIENPSDSIWAALNAPAWSFFGGNPETLEHGLLYNGHAALDERGICPSGWFTPSDDDWKELESHLGMTFLEVDDDGWRGTDEGWQLKSSAQDSPAWDGLNEVGFGASPAGYRASFNGTNYDTDVRGYFWTSSAYASLSWFRMLESDHDQIRRTWSGREAGMSIRCIQDSE